MIHSTSGPLGIFTVRNDDDDTTLHIFWLKPIAHSLASQLTMAAMPGRMAYN